MSEESTSQKDLKYFSSLPLLHGPSEYAESSYIEAVDENGNTTHEANGVGIGMNLYKVKEMIEEKLLRTRYLYNKLLEQQKNYDQQVNSLNNLIVSINEEIGKDDFEENILSKLDGIDVEINIDIFNRKVQD